MTSVSYSTNRIVFQRAAVAITMIGLIIMVAVILSKNGGMLVYSLDDPYIHLSLAENLLRGHYGINPGETASPSSSMLYPFLLALGLGAQLGTYAPLIINVVAMCAAIWLLAGRLFDATATETDHSLSPLRFLALIALMLTFSAIALPLTGMEHSLHVLASVMVIIGLADMVTAKQAPNWMLITGIILCPLLRFEGLALSGAALLMIALSGYWTRAIVTGGVIVAFIAVYIAAMTSLGLPPLPSSVMVKSSASAAAADTNMTSMVQGIIDNLALAFTYRQATFVAVFSAVLALGAALQSTRAMWPVAIAAALAGAAHIVAGRWGWFGRYEVYVLAFQITAILIVFRPMLTAPRVVRVAPAVLIAVGILAAKPYISVTKNTPAAAHWVYGQQFQMHRFATEYFPKVVAVNDLGWVSYDNDTYVLDLWGLGSEQVRKLRAEVGHQPEWIADLAREHGVVYAMVYDQWYFGNLPPEWCRIGTLSTPATDLEFIGDVSIYLVDAAFETDLRDALNQFAPTLPQNVTVTVNDCVS